MVEIERDVILAYALENAVKHDGKAVVGSVLSGLFAEGLEKSEIGKTMPKITEVVKEVNSIELSKQKEMFEGLVDKVSKREVRVGLPELEDAKVGEVIMRFAPFPSGPLHLGNARPLIVNDEYVKKYRGKLILAMDDTIGSEQKPIEPEAYKLIEEGVRWLGANVEKKIFYKSDRIDKYYEYADELIKKGYMYVCSCSQDKFKELKDKGIECPCRQYPHDVQFKKWKDMFSAPEKSVVVRLKTSMQDKDPAFRDRVMFRISDRPHPRIGTKYRVYPTLDFAWAVDDHILGITHILRGMELAIETRVERFIWDIFKWKHPKVIYNGHFEIEGVKISKSKGAKDVKSGEYFGWNDPRVWSLQSLRDRGIQPQAIREFILNMGLRMTNVTVPIDVLYSLNRKVLGDVKRYFFISNPQKIKINGCPVLESDVPFHPNRSLGFRKYKTGQEFLISKQDFDNFEDGNYRLMHILNFKTDKVKRLMPREFSFTSTEPPTDHVPIYMQWLSSDGENVPVRVLMEDGTWVEGLGEPELKKLEVGMVVQFERFGYVRFHSLRDSLDDESRVGDEKGGAKMKKGKVMEFWFTHY